MSAQTTKTNRSVSPSSVFRRRSSAFTLLELLAVITIIAILAGIVIGVGRRASEAGKTARAKAELATLSAALETYKRTYGYCEAIVQRVKDTETGDGHFVITYFRWLGPDDI